MKKPVKKKPDYLEIRIPKFTFREVRANTYLLLTTIIVLAFILGLLTNKVMYLESSAKLIAANAASNTQPTSLPTQPPPPPFEKVANGHFPLLGNTNAKVTVVEFADFRCPFCEQFFTNTLPQLKKDYIDTGKVKLAFRNYAFLGPASTLAGQASECANDQGKFWDYHDYMYKNQPTETDTSMYTVANISQIAGGLGMDQSQFQDCLGSTKFDKDFQDDLSAASTAQVNGTPTFFINGQRLVGAQPFSAIKAVIEQELKKTI